MSKRKTWKCDFENCNEIAEWYRKIRGIPIKLCTRHEAHMRKQRMGKPLDFSQLTADDIWFLEKKEGRFAFKCPNCNCTTALSMEELIENERPICPKCGIIMFHV
jgi:ssDNA-binding Zn-finger/Zn-ribbon topoisomerase 1